MNKQWVTLLTGIVLLHGCATVNKDAIPVIDSGSPVSEGSGRGPAATRTNMASATQQQQQAPAAQAQSTTTPEDSGVVVMVPQASSVPLQTFPAPDSSAISTAPPITMAPVTPDNTNVPQNIPQPSVPTGIPPTTTSSNRSSGTLAADEQLDGPVLALLTTAQRQQGGGDLNGAASSLERAQRIAPREPQVLYRLAQVRLDQGDAAQAEQLSRRALSYSAGRPALQANLWELIAKAREKQGDAAGAAQARQRAGG
ncbi:tetratricopeptide repeat protein [Azomonas macrocytogenes]